MFVDRKILQICRCDWYEILVLEYIEKKYEKKKLYLEKDRAL